MISFKVVQQARLRHGWSLLETPGVKRLELGKDRQGVPYLRVVVASEEAALALPATLDGVRVVSRIEEDT